MSSKLSKKHDPEVHDYDNRIERCYKLLERDLSKNNSELIKKYDKYLVGQTLSKAYRYKAIATLLTLTRLTKKDWFEITKDDVDDLIFKIARLYSNQKGQETNTTVDCKKHLKMFFRWMKFGSRNFKEVGDPEETKAVKIKRVQDKLVREDLVTESDFTRMIHVCKNNRTKAMIAVLQEGGLRPGELLSMKIRHVKFDDYGVMLAVDGKTGTRSVRLIRNVPYLSQWLNEHPFKDDPEAPLFIQLEGKNYGKSLNYYAARKSLVSVAKDAGISKRIYPNLFRHSAATQLANVMTEAQLRKRHGWSPTSKTPARYVHMIDADVDEALMKYYGIKKNEQNKIELPKKCSICDMMNPANEKICSKCRHPLDLKTAIEMDENKSQNQEEQDKKFKDIEKRLNALDDVQFAMIGAISEMIKTDGNGMKKFVSIYEKYREQLTDPKNFQ